MTKSTLLSVNKSTTKVFTFNFYLFIWIFIIYLESFIFFSCLIINRSLLFMFVMYFKRDSYWPGLHSPSLLGTQPSGQVQIMVRTGIVSRTLHREEAAQGDRAIHGFTQVLRIQASWLGHSGSWRHSGSAAGGGRRSQYAIGLPIGRKSGQRQEAKWFLT